MGLFEKLRAELIDIIEWIDDTRGTLVWRFPRFQNEIKHGSNLIVRPGQMAIFVDRGRMADVFAPGNYKLDTKNLPILATLMGWARGFDSPFKAEVYFVNTRQVTELKWGTPNPVILRDPDFGPLRLRAFGTYALKASEPRALLAELVGTDESFEAQEIYELLRSVITSSFAEVIGTMDISAVDLAAHYANIAEKVRTKVNERVDREYGLDVTQLFILNISLPEEVEQALDRRASMEVLGDLQGFQQYQLGTALVAAAENPAGGAAQAGIGMGMGFGLAQQMAQGFAPPHPGGMTPPPPPSQVPWHVALQGQSYGPMTTPQLLDWVRRGQIDGTTLLWIPGWESWRPASSVPEIAPILGSSSPPPLPGAVASIEAPKPPKMTRKKAGRKKKSKTARKKTPSKKRSPRKPR